MGNPNNSNYSQRGSENTNILFFALYRTPRVHQNVVILFSSFQTAVILVYISMISFFIPYEVIAGRMSLLMNCFLMLINLSISAWRSSPKTKDVSWQDIWIMLVMASEVSHILQWSSLILLNNLRKIWAHYIHWILIRPINSQYL